VTRSLGWLGADREQVMAREHGNDARDRTGCARVDADDASVGVRTCHQTSVQKAREVEVIGVPSDPPYLGFPIESSDWSREQCRCLHRFPPLDTADSCVSIADRTVVSALIKGVFKVPEAELNCCRLPSRAVV
jgi:hypothetical protein